MILNGTVGLRKKPRAAKPLPSRLRKCKLVDEEAASSLEQYMTRPLYVATLAITALLAFAAFAMETATAGGRALIAPPAGASANARTAVLPGFPDISGRSVGAFAGRGTHGAIE